MSALFKRVRIVFPSGWLKEHRWKSGVKSPSQMENLNYIICSVICLEHRTYIVL